MGGAIQLFGQQCQGFQQQPQPLHAHGETDARRRLAAELADQPIVAATGADGTLGAELVGDPLEYRAAVIVQPAHQLRIDLIGDADGIESRLESFEMSARLLVEEIGERRRIRQQCLGLRILAVEDAQRVGCQAPLAVFVELVETLLQVGNQRVAIDRTGFAGAQAVQLQGHRIGHAQLFPEARGKHDQLRVDIRPGLVEDFHTDLVKLAVTALLRLLVAKHRAGVPKLLHLATTRQAMFQNGAHTTGGAFGTQREGFLIAVQEGVHLLVHHIGTFADAAGEQLRVFDDGQTDLAVAIAVEQLRESTFQVTPGRRLRRQDIVHATNGLQGLAQFGSLNQLRTISAASASTFSAALRRINCSSSSTSRSLFSFCAGLPSMYTRLFGVPPVRPI